MTRQKPTHMHIEKSMWGMAHVLEAKKHAPREHVTNEDTMDDSKECLQGCTTLQGQKYCRQH